MTFAEQFETYKQNIFSGMLDVLAEDLGVTVTSLRELGVGFYPAKQVWTSAERNHKGEIMGLAFRGMDGKKWMEKGSKRGLIYAYNENYIEGEKRYEPGRCHWIQIHRSGLSCPICKQNDWCRISSDYEDSEGPSAVACSRVAKGSVQDIPPDGHLHILDPGRQRIGMRETGQSILYQTELPYLVVEGYTDVLAAMDLGFVAIGRPSAKGGMEELKQMPLAGKEIWIIGENDAGIGKAGMEKTLLNLEHLSDKISCVMPPEGVKDLRQWVNNGLTQEALTTYIQKFGQGKLKNPDVFPDDIALTVAGRFLENYQTDDGQQTLRSYHGDWAIWDAGRYNCVDQDVFRGRLYQFLEGKRYIKQTPKGTEIVSYKPTRGKVSDIVDALSSYCPVVNTPPAWIDQKDRPNITNLIAFKNGLLDVDDFCKDRITLLEPTPDLFTFATLPYDYSPKIWSNLFEEICDSIFNGDEDSIRLLAQWLGYNIVYDTSQEKFMMFVGQTRSGKSTISDALAAMLGSEQCGTTSLPMLANIHGLSSLIGKSTVIAGDIKGTIRWAEMDAALENILRITGRDKVPINPKFVAPYDTELPCRFTMAMNDLPMFTDHSKAIVARTLILNFPNSFIGREDFTLKNRLREEAAAGKLINFALWGLKDLREQGRFIEPEASQKKMTRFIKLTSPMQAFVDECCYVNNKAKVSKTQMYEAWKGWCSACDRKQGNKMLFDSWLCQFVPTVTVKADGDTQFYRGVTLNPFAYRTFLGRPE